MPKNKKNLEKELPELRKDMPKLLRGFKDILPEDEKYWDFIFNTVRKVLRNYGFARLETPVLEIPELFEKSVGAVTDIVSKEMYRFNLPTAEGSDGKKTSSDPGREVVLRPENTAPVVRAYLEHGLMSQLQPVKLWYLGPMFRHDRPQAGRYRQFYQLGMEVLGEQSPMVDAQVIIVAYNIYKALGLDVTIPINSLGDKECRPQYLEQLREFLKTRTKHMCSDCQQRSKINPLRVFDCKETNCQQVLEEAPQTVDWLCEECRNHFVEVLELLDEVEVPYALNPRLVRGLDYYTRTTFEVFLAGSSSGDNQPSPESERQTKLDSLGGGGRYDGLAEQISGQYVPAAGFAGGVERTILAMKDKQVMVPEVGQVDVFLAQLGREPRRKATKLYEQLRNKGFKVGEQFAKEGLSAQLEKANKVGAELTLILGQKELLNKTILIRDMSSGIQEEVNMDKLIQELEKRLSQVTVTRIEPTEIATTTANEAINSEDSVQPEGKAKGDEAGSDIEQTDHNQGKEVGHE